MPEPEVAGHAPHIEAATAAPHSRADLTRQITEAVDSVIRSFRRKSFANATVPTTEIVPVTVMVGNQRVTRQDVTCSPEPRTERTPQNGRVEITKPKKDVIVVRIAGDFFGGDFALVEHSKTQVVASIDGMKKPIAIVNCKDLKQFNADGIMPILLDVLVKVRKQGGRAIVTDAPDRLREVITMQLQGFLELFSTEKEALRSV